MGPKLAQSSFDNATSKNKYFQDILSIFFEVSFFPGTEFSSPLSMLSQNCVGVHDILVKCGRDSVNLGRPKMSNFKSFLQSFGE